MVFSSLSHFAGVILVLLSRRWHMKFAFVMEMHSIFTTNYMENYYDKPAV